MKFLKYALLFAAVTIMFSCSDDDNGNEPQPIDETDGLLLTKTFENQNHKIAIYTESGKLTEGYNKIYLQLKNNDGSLITNSNFSWMPMMDMGTMQHGAPHSDIQKVSGKQSLYEGWIVFQMAGSWDLSFEYSVGGSSYEMSNAIEVQEASKRRVTTFVGSDENNYIVALVEPSDPKVAVNDMTAAIFKMGSMHDFPIVNNYKLKIDPRMPGMGNHGSPNNVDLTQISDGFYHGKLSLTMTGYWIINLMLENQNGEILKGEEVTESNPQSSIFFEIEF